MLFFKTGTLGEDGNTYRKAARSLQKAGLITYHRGKITILDRAKLEAASCECYRIVRAELDRVAE